MYEFVLAFSKYVWGVIWRAWFFSFALIYFYITCIITQKKLKPEETLACENMRFSSLFIPRCTVGPNIVGSCCIRLHTVANMHATNPNIVAPTMLGVVASNCTQHKTAGKFLTWFWVFLLKRKKIPTQGSNEEFRIPMSLSHHYTCTITATRQNSEKFKYIPKGVVLAPCWSENRYRFFPFQSWIGYGLQLNYGSVWINVLVASIIND